MPQRAGNRSLEATDVEFPVHTVYRAPNSAFVGREDILENMHRKIEGPSISEHGQQQSPLICVLHGLGGVGKTLIALKYFHEHRSDYDAAFWLEAEQDWSLEASFTRIAEKLKLATRMSSESETSSALYNAVEQGREWLQTTERRWILVFDNVEDFDEVARYMPGDCRANCTIIITTQSPNVPHWLGNFEMIHVTALDPESAADCIFKYLDREPFDDEEKDVACELAEHVGCLPLAMATIGGYVKQSDMPLVDFFENIKQKATLWENAPKIKETQGYYGSLQSVFNKAFEDLTPSARELLNVLAFYDPEYIPEDIFIAAIDARKFEHIHNKGDLFACYFELRNRQLVRRDTANRDSYISIHRVVQWNVLLDLSCDYDKRWTCFKQAFDIVKALLPKTDPKVVPEPNIWKDYVKHGRQILALRTHCLWPEPPVQLPMAFADILSEMGTYMWFSGKISEGKRILRTAESIIDDKNIKPSDERRAHVYQVLGIITSFEGVSEREGSMQMRKNAYHSRNQGLGRKPERELTRDEAIMVWAVYSDMAFGFIQEEDFFETKQYMEKCLAQYRKWESDEMTIPYEYAKYYQLMSYCHMAGQKPMDAMHAITRCHELTQRAVGNEHSFSQLIKFCHANLLWHTKGPDARAEALAINKSVLAYRRQLLGEYSQFVLESYSTCGKLCHEAGELTSAKGYLETCLQRRKRAVWNEEGITRAYFRYAGVLRTLAERAKADGNAGEAEALIQKADGISANVTKIVQRYRIDYARYLPKSESASEEANLDQMVSIWSGRFTGRLVQHNMDLSGIDDVDFEGPPVKRRRIGAG
ncbi:hypothetical protein B0A48_13210 [Cryoendolithus antarcticus]|uniref:Uncharacterized protein n=1 Tax=Cryoendolithus antarcticus TaxID=1507870 RepID=A0A1V8SNN6_9PEZI|nr:hypothetical protein B0A48_13210 [Cryoendolithus antarcticus]